MNTLPYSFVNSIISIHGTKGNSWLNRLPAVLARIAAEWSIHLNEAYHCTAYSLIASGVGQGGREIVLKASMPGREFENQIAALRCYNGCGAVKVIQANTEDGLLLMEKVCHGTPLTRLATDTTDTQATSFAVTVMQKLWTDVPTKHTFPLVKTWLEDLTSKKQPLLEPDCPLPEWLVAEAVDLAGYLLATSSDPVLLHGDLHHDNILSCQHSGWIAIDPKGVIGEPAYETGAILRNLWADRNHVANPVEIIHRRVDQFAEELAIDKTRIRSWGIVQAVLAAIWCLEDNLDCLHQMVECAEILVKI